MLSAESSNRVLTTTRFKLVPKVVDTVLRSNVFATRMLEKAQKFSGYSMKFPFKYTTNNQFEVFDGFDTLSTTAVQTRTNLEFFPSFSGIPVVIALTELAKNETEEGVLDLMALEMKSTAQDMADQIGTLFYADGTGTGGKAPLGLAAIVDDGTSVATYGGQARATYTTLKATKTASGGALSLAKMATLWNTLSDGTVTPTIGITDKTTWSLYEQLLTPQERINKTPTSYKGGLKGSTGYTGLDYKGMPILSDQKATSGYLYFLNEDFIAWYGMNIPQSEPVRYKSVDIEGNDYSNVMGLGFNWIDWVRPINGLQLVGRIVLGGQLICENPRRQGVLTGITGV
jgi:hypothetical protein